MDRPRSIRIRLDKVDCRPALDEIWRFLNETPNVYNCIQSVSKTVMVATLRLQEDADKLAEKETLVVGNGTIRMERAGSNFKSVLVKGLPFEITEHQVKSGYSRYGRVISTSRLRAKTNDRYNGIYTGNWIVRIDVEKEIPNVLRFGRDVAYNIYEGVRRTCNKCGQEGHRSDSCNKRTCWNCKGEHFESDCTEVCGACGSIDHKRSKCSIRSWASVAASRPDMMEDENVLRESYTIEEDDSDALPTDEPRQCVSEMNIRHENLSDSENDEETLQIARMERERILREQLYLSESSEEEGAEPITSVAEGPMAEKQEKRPNNLENTGKKKRKPIKQRKGAVNKKLTLQDFVIPEKETVAGGNRSEPSEGSEKGAEPSTNPKKRSRKKKPECCED